MPRISPSAHTMVPNALTPSTFTEISSPISGRPLAHSRAPVPEMSTRSTDREPVGVVTTARRGPSVRGAMRRPPPLDLPNVPILGPHARGPLPGTHSAQRIDRQLAWLVVAWHHTGRLALSPRLTSKFPATFSSPGAYAYVEVLVRTFWATRPNGSRLLVDEFWDFVDMSPRFTGTNYVPGMRRLASRDGGEVRQIDDDTFQLISSGEILTDVCPVSPLTRRTPMPEPAV